MVSKNPLKRLLFLILGFVLTAVGALGVILPILPTTPFVLLAGFCFVKSSDKLHAWLMNHPKLGPGMHRIRTGQGIPLKTKVISTGLAALALGSFALWGTTNLHARIAISLVLVAKIIAMIRIPTYKPIPDTKKTEQVLNFRIKAPSKYIAAIFVVGTGFVFAQTLFALELGVWGIGLIRGTGFIPYTLLGLIGLRWIFLLTNRYLGAVISQSIRKDTRARIYRELTVCGSDEIRTRGQGVIHELLNDKVEALDPLYSLYLPQLFIGIISPIVALGVVFRYDWYIGTGLLVLMPLAPFILGLLRKRFQVVGTRYSAASSDLGSWYVESIRAIPTLTLFQRIEGYKAVLFRASSQLRDKTIHLLAVNQLALLLVELFFSLSLLALATFLGYSRYLAGQAEPAFVIALPFLVIELIRPINLVGAFFFAGAAGRQAKKSLQEFATGLMENNARVLARGNRDSGDPNRTNRGLEINHVEFAYPDAPEKTILRDFSLTLQPGEILGLQGPSGSGKSTLAKLILGFYTPQKGSIFLDGVDLTRLTRSSEDLQARAQLLGYLPQRPYLFATSLRENIQMGNTALSDGVIHQSLQSAGIGDFIQRGLESNLGEDAAQISGGERLRIALARVFAHGARYVILDEPTAELDSLSETDLWKELRSSGLGVLLIAHRKSTLEKCSRVVTMEGVQV